MSSVIVDNEVGGQLALEHLYSLGHRKIAFIRGPKALTDSSPRWRGIRNFVKNRAGDRFRDWFWTCRNRAIRFPVSNLATN